jgi:hypothetical protein
MALQDPAREVLVALDDQIVFDLFLGNHRLHLVSKQSRIIFHHVQTLQTLAMVIVILQDLHENRTAEDLPMDATHETPVNLAMHAIYAILVAVIVEATRPMRTLTDQEGASAQTPPCRVAAMIEELMVESPKVAGGTIDQERWTEIALQDGTDRPQDHLLEKEIHSIAPAGGQVIGRMPMSLLRSPRPLLLDDRDLHNPIPSILNELG